MAELWTLARGSRSNQDTIAGTASYNEVDYLEIVLAIYFRCHFELLFDNSTPMMFLYIASDSRRALQSWGLLSNAMAHSENPPTNSQLDIQGLASKHDKNGMAGVIDRLPDQIEFAICDPGFPEIKQSPINKVVVAGMGGSSMIVEMLVGAFPDAVTVPLHVSRDYRTSTSVDSSTLVIASSFSGNTEETIAATEAMKNAGANIVALSSGGRLCDLAIQSGFPIVRLPAEREGDGFQPRSASGYMITYLARILVSAGVAKIPLEEFESLPRFLKGIGLSAEAVSLARQLEDRIPIIYTDAIHQYSIGRSVKIKFNENAKRPAFFNSLPEINHNEMIGFESPIGSFAIIFFRDPSSDRRLDTRFETMRKIFKKRGLSHVSFHQWTLVGSTNLEKIVAANIFGDWCSYATALLDGIDPTPVSMVEDFKVDLSKAHE